MNELYYPTIREVALEASPDDSVIRHIDPEQTNPGGTCEMCVDGLTQDILNYDDPRLSSVGSDEIFQALPEVLEGTYEEI